MPEICVTVAIPTLFAGEPLTECIRALLRQTRRDYEVIVIDNSGSGEVGRAGVAGPGVRVIENRRNEGFGRAINQAFRASTAPYLATLNDDAVAAPNWLDTLVRSLQESPRAGMCASRVVFTGSAALDSAGMLLCADGSSRQRGHRQPPERFSGVAPVLLPSGAAALYRRAMLDQIGLFDDEYFLYCEDTDLGLRARWAGWECCYAPGALVEHRYSHSAGQASALKAYYVERNRLFTILKNFPARLLWRAPVASVERYAWHVYYLLQGRGTAAQAQRDGTSPWQLAYLLTRAHVTAAMHLPRLYRQRRAIQQQAQITTDEFLALLRQHAISPREVAAL